MFKCKVCLEKDKRIAELKEQISYFKTLLNPPPRINKYELEETVVMNGGGGEEVSVEPIDLETEAKENARIQRETDFIFSGNTEEVN